MPSHLNRRFAVLLAAGVAGVLLFALATSVLLTQAGIHGFFYQRIREAQDLRSAIEPPPLFLVESMLVAHELVDDQDASGQLARFATLRRDFLAQEVVWQQRLGDHDAGPVLAGMLASGRRFLALAEQEFLPALARGDRGAAKSILEGALTGAYNEHRTQVVALLAHLQRLHRDAEHRAGVLQLGGAIALGVILLALLGTGLGLLRVRSSHQQEIRERETHLRFLSDAAFEGIAITEGTTVVDANPQLARMLALARVKDLEGTSLLRYLAPASHPSFLSCLAEQSEADHELRLVRADGTEIDVEARVRHHQEHGRAIRLVALRDITAHKRAERELLAFRDHLQELVDQRSRELGLERDRLESYINVSSALIVVLDLDGRIVRINPYGCDLLGWAITGLTGRNWFETCVPPAERAGVLAYFHSYAHDDAKRGAGDFTADTFENDIICRDGRIRRLLFRNAWLRDAEGQVCGTISSAIDVTTAREAEQVLRKAKDEAERANRAKSEFLASMSHEIRTPLNAVLGYTQLLKRDGSLDARHQRAIEVINRSGEHLLTLISDILEMSRIEAGRSTSDLAPCDLLDLIDGVKSLFLLRARDKGLELQLRFAPDLPPHVRTDAQKLRQILVNLVGNALKFTQAGTITLEASYAAGFLRLEVCDSGVGISDDELQLLFRPFVQVRAGRVRGDGTGLGLAISRGMAEVMGGTLTARSEPRLGSTFSLAIPAETCASAPRSQARSAPVIALAPGCPPPRVLIAEDHADSRELLKDLLESVGLSVRAVGDGAAAVACCRSWRPDLVWMDIDMPVMDGLRATTAIRAAIPGPRPVIIALTAAAFTEDREHILASGCDEVAHKPYDEERLFTLMEQTLGIRFQRRDEPAAAAGGTTPAAKLGAGFAALPAAEREAFRQALVIGDLTAVIARCAHWHDRESATAVCALAENMDMERLMRLVEQPASDPAAGGRP